MTPDVLVGIDIAAASVAVLVADWAVGRWTLTRRPALEPVESDDVAVARAVGVLLPTTEGGMSSGQMAAAIAHHAQRPVDEPAVVDHVLCAGLCGRILCCCRPLHTSPRCAQTVEQACGHLNPLCEFCAPGCCFECLTEQLQAMRGGAW